jgi:hypothetical protein
MSPAPWLVQLEGSLEEDDESLAVGIVVLASVAGREVHIEPDVVQGAARRALLVLAAGGGPERGLDLNGRAVHAMADELRTVDRQLALERGLDDVKAQAKGLSHVSEAVAALRATPDVAWRAYACSLLAEELGGVDE